MAKDNTFYFSHDYSVRSDIKIKALIRKHKYLGYGLFWAIVEDLYNNANALPMDYDGIAFDLHTEPNTIKSIIEGFDLFVINDGVFSSESVKSRLEFREKKTLNAKKSANYRWSKNNEDANALQTHSESNAIKESKVNKSKINNIEERKLKFASTLEIYKDKYPRSLLASFFKYWTEPNKTNTKFKQELEKTWSLERRLETWATNDSNFNKKQDNTPEKKYKEFK
jgi:hypothetical protein